LPYPDAIVAIGAAIIGITSGVLGAFAVLRQRTLVSDALSHAALPGICVAFLLTGVKDPAPLLLGAALAGIVASLVMLLIERTTRIRPDAAIGVVLSSVFALGVVLLTHIGSMNNANQAGLERYLFGQAAGMVENDIWMMFGLSSITILIVATTFKP